MRATSFRLSNFRSFVDTDQIDLGNITVLVGANNAGKSTIIRALYYMQYPHLFNYLDVRSGSTKASIDIPLDDCADLRNLLPAGPESRICFRADATINELRTGLTSSSHVFQANGLNSELVSIPSNLQAVEPRHFVVPLLTQRKPERYSEVTNETATKAVDPRNPNLAAKLGRACVPGHPSNEQYVSQCTEILGFVVGAVDSPNGSLPGVYLPNGEPIFLSHLGEGVANIVTLLAYLTNSTGKLFLIEEPENDLHPQALKSLLNLIEVSSERNQFVISTHSNIVVRHLCSNANANLYQVRAKSNKMPTESEVVPVQNTSEARIAVLAELGYTLTDFDLWEGWLILEESTAERIIRDYLIPWFVPSLKSLRTVSSGGATKVNAFVEDLFRLYLFTNLTPAHKGKCWVLVDGDEAGHKAIESLRAKFTSVPLDRLKILGEHNFEEYYPSKFAEKIRDTLKIEDKGDKREKKRQLFHEVNAWLESNPDEGKRALKESANEVISVLREIEMAMQEK